MQPSKKTVYSCLTWVWKKRYRNVPVNDGELENEYAWTVGETYNPEEKQVRSQSRYSNQLTEIHTKS